MMNAPTWKIDPNGRRAQSSTGGGGDFADATPPDVRPCDWLGYARASTEDMKGDLDFGWTQHKPTDVRVSQIPGAGQYTPCDRLRNPVKGDDAPCQKGDDVKPKCSVKIWIRKGQDYEMKTKNTVLWKHEKKHAEDWALT